MNKPDLDISPVPSVIRVQAPNIRVALAKARQVIRSPWCWDTRQLRVGLYEFRLKPGKLDKSMTADNSRFEV